MQIDKVEPLINTKAQTNNFSRRLDRACSLNGVTLESLAEITGIQLRIIDAYILGSRLLQAGHLKKIAAFFSLPEKWFLGQVDLLDVPINPKQINITPREYDVLHYLLLGCSNQEIADKLELKIVTVKLHVGNLCKKMQAKNRTHMALIAQKFGL